jgi:uncharacterized protein (TIGR00297 family)
VVLSITGALIGIAATALLAAGAVASGALTRWAGVVATAFGVVIVVAGGYPYLALLVLFVAASVLATRYAFEEKARRKVQEGTAGERGVSNVVAHIVLPTALVLGATLLGRGAASPAELPLLFTAALSFGAADTFASEFGVLSGAARSILTLRRVEPGTNGGVSLLGTLWAFTGAATTAAIGWLLFYLFATPQLPAGVAIPIALLAGFLGCQIDSVLGELLENRGYLTKGSTNFLGMLSSIVLAGLLLVALGGML